MSRFRFTPWAAFGPNLDRNVIRSWLSEVRRSSFRIFENGLRNGPHTGRIYTRGAGRTHQASRNEPARSEFPANDTGGLLASLKTRQERTRVTIGTSQFYSRFLRLGTENMNRRRMSDDAITQGALEARPHSRGWVKFRKGVQRARQF